MGGLGGREDTFCRVCLSTGGWRGKLCAATTGGRVNKEYYLELRNRYKPAHIKTVFILESPPASGKYFYDETGLISEPLFSAMMELLSYKPQNKKEGLKYFSSTGHFLVDATYEPVNKLKGRARENTILNSYSDLADDLKNLGNPDTINFVLIKANICRLLQDRLIADGFNVVNKGVTIPFPSTGQQGNFRKMISQVYQFNLVNA
jgi:hypothetical protein